MLITDEAGREWKVVKGDAGYDRVMKLKRAGFEYIVLVKDALAGLEFEVPQINRTDWREVRLVDCCKFLKGEIDDKRTLYVGAGETSTILSGLSGEGERET